MNLNHKIYIQRMQPTNTHYYRYIQPMTNSSPYQSNERKYYYQNVHAIKSPMLVGKNRHESSNKAVSDEEDRLSSINSNKKVRFSDVVAVYDDNFESKISLNYSENKKYPASILRASLTKSSLETESFYDNYNSVNNKRIFITNANNSSLIDVDDEYDNQFDKAFYNAKLNNKRVMRPHMINDDDKCSCYDEDTDSLRENFEKSKKNSGTNKKLKTINGLIKNIYIKRIMTKLNNGAEIIKKSLA